MYSELRPRVVRANVSSYPGGIPLVPHVLVWLVSPPVLCRTLVWTKAKVPERHVSLKGDALSQKSERTPQLGPRLNAHPITKP